MQPKYLTVLRWALNALLVLAAFLVESVCFGRNGVAGAMSILFLIPHRLSKHACH